MFLRTREGDLIALIDVRKIFDIEHADGSHTTLAVMRADNEAIELACDYNIASLAKVLDPIRASR